MVGFKKRVRVVKTAAIPPISSPNSFTVAVAA
jgi:hypothetical protein